MEAPLNVATERIDDIVLLVNVMKQIELPQMLDKHLPSHWKQKGLSWGWVVTLWLSYILSEGDHRKVVVQEWVKQRQKTLEQLCAQELREPDLSDDRLSIVLKYLSEEERWQEIEKEMNTRMLRGYALPQETIRMDATTVSGEHLVNEAGVFQFGHSKDDPSLAQVKVMMAELDPLGLPLVTQVVSGEQADDVLYIPAFEQARQCLSEQMLWVGDCKMGALATRAHIQQHQHYYLMPLARTGSVPQQMRDWIEQLSSTAQKREEVKILKADGTVARVIEGYVTTRELKTQLPTGEMLHWSEQVFLAHSDKHHHQQQNSLEQRLQTATQKLLALTPTVGRGHRQIRVESELHQKAQAILKAHRVEGLLDFSFEFQPLTKTRKPRYQITAVTRNFSALEQHQFDFGWRAYVSNAPSSRLNFESAVLTYRDEWIVEHSFHRLKGKSLGATPLFVKRDDQVLGLLHLLSLGLRLLSLIEFVVHRQLASTHDSLSGLYPENPKKTTAKPRTERLLKAFNNITLTAFTVHEQSYRHLPPLTPLQEKILHLLGLSSHIYTDLLARPG
ncbi:MAG: IS1634 family transposase [Microcoleaceae cyanobacterium]